VLRATTRPRHTARGGDTGYARHDSPMASGTGHSEVDLRQEAAGPTWRAARDPPSGDPAGDRESRLGVAAEP
jgi:hypothetical protein